MEGVPGIRTSLESRHCRIASGEDIDNLSFSLVSPLESEYHVKF